MSRKQALLKEQVIFRKLMRFKYIWHLPLAIPIVAAKLAALYGIFLYNGFNIPLFNRWSVLFRGNAHPMFSKDTLVFIVLMLINYWVAIVFRSFIDYKSLVSTLEIYRNNLIWKRSADKQKEIDDHYVKQLKGILKPFSFHSYKVDLVQLFRDLDYVSFFWTLILFPVVYNYEYLVPTIKILYPNDSNKVIAFRASAGVRQKSDKLFWFTLLMWIVNTVIPAAVMVYTLSRPEFEVYDNYVLIGIFLINLLTYPIIKYKHLSVWIPENPFKVNEKMIKNAHKSNPFNWTKLFKSMGEGFKDGDEDLVEYSKDNENKKE